jgi:hypothetical protein
MTESEPTRVLSLREKLKLKREEERRQEITLKPLPIFQASESQPGLGKGVWAEETIAEVELKSVNLPKKKALPSEIEVKHHPLTPEVVSLLNPLGSTFDDEQPIINLSYFVQSRFPSSPPVEWSSLKPQLAFAPRRALTNALRTLYRNDIKTVGEIRSLELERLHKDGRLRLNTAEILKTIFTAPKETDAM